MASAGFIVRTKRNAHAELVEYVARAMIARPTLCLFNHEDKPAESRNLGVKLHEHFVYLAQRVASDSCRAQLLTTYECAHGENQSALVCNVFFAHGTIDRTSRDVVDRIDGAVTRSVQFQEGYYSLILKVRLM